MNLAWSINENLLKSGDTDGLNKKNVAVVGAGLGGLTCAVAMSLYGAMVTLLDRQPELMGPMATASHRDIHPTMNFWPVEEIAVSTNFPFFNWYQDSCDNILRRIRTEFESYQADYNIMGPHMNCEVTKLTAERDGTWALAVQPKGAPEYKSRHQIVVLATGFGREKHLAADDPGYWDFVADPIRPLQENNANPFRSYVVSGTGDGGLIEVLRLLFTSFRAGQIEDATAPLMKQPGLNALVQRIEAQIRQHVLDAVLHEGAKLSDEFKDDLSERLWSKYKECAARWIGPAAKAELAAKLGAIKHVVLIGHRPTPLEYGAAPYHRLLIAMCIECGWVTYYQVKTTKVSPDVREVVLPGIATPIKAKRIDVVAKKTISQTGDEIHGPKHDLAFEDSLFLRRHGATTPIDALFKRVGDRDRIRRIQAVYADQDWLTLEQLADYAEKLELPAPYNKFGWANGLSEFAEAYFSERHGLDIKLDVKGEYMLLRGGPNWNERLFEKNRRLVPSKFLDIKVSKKIREFAVVQDESGFPD